jgi:hypothetical protein
LRPMRQCIEYCPPHLLSSITKVNELVSLDDHISIVPEGSRLRACVLSGTLPEHVHEAGIWRLPLHIAPR